MGMPIIIGNNDQIGMPGPYVSSRTEVLGACIEVEPERRPAGSGAALMLKVIVELHPHGDSRRRKRIAELVIANDGTGDHEIGNYVVMDRRPRDAGLVLARVHGHQRLDGVWVLLKAALTAVDREHGLVNLR